MRIPVYIVYKSAGQFDVYGNEMIIIIALKSTRASAEALASREEDAKIVKMQADKFID